MSELQFDQNLAAEVAHRLDLREPNRKAVETVALRTSDHYDIQGLTSGFECIVDSATGVGKTFIMAGVIEYLAGVESPARNFLVLAPGRTIRNKTIKNFTANNPRSLTASMRSAPYVVTADNFNTQRSLEKMLNPAVTKVFVFTAHALTSRTGEGRATHDLDENLGTSLFGHLRGLDDLVILADEHHCYRGPGFSRTIRDLDARLVVGLTATPESADKKLVIFRYPLAQAIADKLVKAPVIVARRDDRTDTETKLLDGVTLLKRKAEVAHAYASDNDLAPVNPVMLVIAKDTTEANEYRDMLDSSSFDGGAWVGRTLLVHSTLTGDEKEQALAALDAVEELDSPVRIIISVNMLKEGWDVKNVYVIASMRASASEVMTEQTLGRGLRLPFGSYTGVEFLDTLEVLAHEKYAELLKKRNVLNEQFMDYSTFASVHRRPDGSLFVREETEVIDQEVIPEDDPEVEVPDPTDIGGETRPSPSKPPSVGVIDLEARNREAERASQNAGLKVKYNPLDGKPDIVIPKFVIEVRTVKVSLNDITDYARFEQLGASLSSDFADDNLRRTRITATTADGKTTMSTEAAADMVRSSQLVALPLAESERMLLAQIMAVKGIDRRPPEVNAAKDIISKVVRAMGPDAEAQLSLYGERCARKLVEEVRKALASATSSEVSFDSSIELVALNKSREATRRQVSGHADGSFDRQIAFNGWKKNLYSHAWFDTEPEFKAANAFDDDRNTVVVWARLHINDIPIEWNAEGRRYNPDFVVIEEVDGAKKGWLVETKGQDRIDSAEVVAKKRVAQRWANEATRDDRVDLAWGYLLLSQSDVDNAQGNWNHLKAFGSLT